MRNVCVAYFQSRKEDFFSSGTSIAGCPEGEYSFDIKKLIVRLMSRSE